VKYSVCRSGVEIGDFEEYEFREKLKANEIIPHDWYWHEGMKEWRRLEEIYPVRQKKQSPFPQADTDILVREGKKAYLSNGRGGTPENVHAFRMFLRAAIGGNAEAQFSLAVCYRDGNGIPLNYKEAARWFRMAAEQGHAEAQYSLGNCYRLGHGVPYDYAEAIQWFGRAAERGDADARFAMEVIALVPSR
jgi:TPR repeat protein